MADTYCGKSCTACAYKEKLQCPGCKAGPGHGSDGNCNIARCCQGSRKRACSACSASGRCGSLDTCHRIPEDRFKCREAEEKKLANNAVRLPGLRKRFLALFWLTLLGTAASFLASAEGIRLAPSLYWLAQLSQLAVGLVLMGMYPAGSRYRAAGICVIAAAAVSTAGPWITAPDWLAFLLAMASPITLLAGECLTFSSHAAVLTDTDPTLSQKWDDLWKWRVIVYADTMVGTVLRFYSGVHSMLTILILTVYAAVLILVYICLLSHKWCSLWPWRHAVYMVMIAATVLGYFDGFFALLTAFFNAFTFILIPVYLYRTVKRL